MPDQRSEPPRLDPCRFEPPRFEPLRDGALLLCLGIAAVANFLAHRNFYFEDAFITYRYADHLAQGLGMVFNPGERVLGASSALYTLLLAALTRLGLGVVDAGGWVYAISLSASGWIVARHLAAKGLANAGVVFALLAAWGAGGTLRFFGMETALYILLIVASVAWAARTADAKSPWVMGLLLGLTCLTRYDGVIIAFVVGLYLWSRRRRPPWSEAFITCGILGLWLLFAWQYFGSPLPNTLGAKAGDSSVSSYMLSAWRNLQVALFSPLHYRWSLPSWPWRYAIWLLLVVPSLLLGRRLTRRHPSLWMWPGITLLLFTGYAVIGPPKDHHWYQMPSLYCFLVFAVAAWGEAWRPLPRHWLRAASLVLIVASAVAIPLTAAKEGRHHETGGPPGRITSYRQFADWILERGLSDTSILTHEPGFLTFHTGQRAIDAAGLVTKGIYFHGPQDRRSGLFELIDHFEPDFLVLKQDRPSLAPRLTERYRKVSEGMPNLALFISHRLYRERSDVMQRPWLEDAPAAPVSSIEASSGEASSGEASTGEASAAATESPIGGWRVIGRPFDSAAGTGIAWTVPKVIDFDEISFAFGANSREVQLEVLVDDAVVWQLDDRGRSRQAQREVLSLYPWRGRLARLRLHDADADRGALSFSDLRLHRYASKKILQDFESSDGEAFWQPQENTGSAVESAQGGAQALPVQSNRAMGLRFGFQQTQGRRLASSLGSEQPRRFFSRPFTLSEDRLQMMVYDLGGPATSLSLWVDGERVRAFKGTASGQLRMLRWGVKAWRGQRAVLQLRDDDGEAHKGLAIDALLLYSY